tara:strand:- start:476 stop:733 length:258 start_codon:yes stop_codon:yes gene_type:complete
MLKSKTVWAAVTAIIGALGGYFTGEIEMGEMLQLVVTSALAVFLRHGVQKSEEAAADATDAALDAASAATARLSTPVAKKKSTGG